MAPRQDIAEPRNRLMFEIDSKSLKTDGPFR